MGKAITYFILAAVILTLPTFLGTITVTSWANADINSISKLTQTTNKIFEHMAPMIEVMCYISGVVFAMQGALSLKKHDEEGYIKSDENYNQIKKDNIKSDENILNIQKEEIKIVEFKFNLDFENKLLNNKLIDIEKVINSIISLPVLENDLENKNLVSSTQDKYIQQIHIAYISIPKELRDKQIKNSTATALAMEQLILIENGLIEIENGLLNQQIKDLNIMNRFLKEKFSEEKKYLTV